MSRTMFRRRYHNCRLNVSELLFDSPRSSASMVQMNVMSSLSHYLFAKTKPISGPSARAKPQPWVCKLKQLVPSCKRMRRAVNNTVYTYKGSTPYRHAPKWWMIIITIVTFGTCIAVIVIVNMLYLIILVSVTGLLLAPLSLLFWTTNIIVMIIIVAQFYMSWISCLIVGHYCCQYYHLYTRVPM